MEVRQLRICRSRPVRAVLREHALFLGGVAAFWLVALAAGARALAVPLLALLLGLSVWGLLGLTDLLASGVERVSRLRLPPRFAAWLRHRTREGAVALGIVLAASGGFAVILTFGTAKPLIGTMAHYRWDGLFAAWDRALHGGVDPWVVTHALPGKPVTSVLLDRLYLGWYLVTVAACLAAVVTSRRTLRQQYLLTLLLLWSVAGTGLAIAFASGGPVFYQALTGQPGTFAPLAAELSRSELLAASIQDKLWRLHLAGNVVPFSGISAMPSVHVGAAALVGLFALRLHPALGAAGLLYWLLIMAGSVHLGWHYAVDGYAGTAFALASWSAMGPVARWWLDRPHGGRPAPLSPGSQAGAPALDGHSRADLQDRDRHPCCLG